MTENPPRADNLILNKSRPDIAELPTIYNRLPIVSRDIFVGHPVACDGNAHELRKNPRNWLRSCKQIENRLFQFVYKKFATCLQVLKAILRLIQYTQGRYGTCKAPGGHKNDSTDPIGLASIENANRAEALAQPAYTVG
ncbi:MAG: hypothetical protein IPN19_02275 [Elusimicrobia bacterium]|nr:hypothetical protein [Elusimicrobiota bacterium]